MVSERGCGGFCLGGGGVRVCPMILCCSSPVIGRGGEGSWICGDTGLECFGWGCGWEWDGGRDMNLVGWDRMAWSHFGSRLCVSVGKKIQEGRQGMRSNFRDCVGGTREAKSSAEERGSRGTKNG